MFHVEHFFLPQEKLFVEQVLTKIFGAGAPVVRQRLFCMGLKNV
jgi:hypothetical protein